MELTHLVVSRFALVTATAHWVAIRSHLVAHPGVRFLRRLQSDAEGAEIHRFDRNMYAYAWKPLELALEWSYSPTVTDEVIGLRRCATPENVNRITSDPPPRAQRDPVVHYTPHYLYAPAVPFNVASFYPGAAYLRFLVCFLSS